MSVDVAAADAAAEPAASPGADRNQILTYIGMLALLVGFANTGGGLIAIPVSFMLKNKLHLASHDVANFRLVAAIPLFLGFMFGFARDRWNVFGRKDRGLLMLFGGLGAAIYLYFAYAQTTYWTLMGAVVLATCAYLFTSAAKSGLASQ